MVPRTLFSPIIFNFGELDSIVIARIIGMYITLSYNVQRMIKLAINTLVREKKQNGGWKLSDTDWLYVSFYNPSCFFFFMIWVDPSPILFYFILFFSIRVGPSRSELIRPGLAVRVDPVRLLYLPLNNEWNLYSKIVNYCILCEVCMIKTAPQGTVSPHMWCIKSIKGYAPRFVGK